MKLEYEQKLIREFAEKCIAQGFRFFISARGNYGFLTDGNRVVTVQVEFAWLSFGGTYVTESPKTTGSGWRIYDTDDPAELLQADAPRWATEGVRWRHKTLEEYLKNYQASSRFIEYKRE